MYILQIENLHKKYDNFQALKGVDLSIKKGEIYGEDTKLGVLMSGKYYLGIDNKKDVDFYVIKGVAEEVLDYLGYAGRYSFVMPKQMPSQMHPGQTADISVNSPKKENRL